MEFPEDFYIKIEECLKNEKFIEILNKLGVNPKVEDVKEYIIDDLKGEFRGKKAIDIFFEVMDSYINNNELQRNESGLIEFNSVLPIKEEHQSIGIRTYGRYLGQDNKIYYIKEAEGLRGYAAGKKYRREGLYNPAMANAFFEFCGEKSSQGIPAIEKAPYYVIFSEDFKQKNEQIVSLKKFDYDYEYDENGNIKHKDIIKSIETYTRSVLQGQMSDEKIDEECRKLKLQYSIQETLKKIICSMDENFGNTSLLIKRNGDKIEEINLSPAYDMDLSFNLGKEFLSIDYTNQIFYRTTETGSNDLMDIITEFAQTIPGYKERLSEIINKFNNDYPNQIFETAYNNTKVDAFKNENLKEEYATFLVQRIAYVKKIVKKLSEKEQSKDETYKE